MGGGFAARRRIPAILLDLAAVRTSACRPPRPAAGIPSRTPTRSSPGRRITIAVTDSGLGGLSIMAEAAARMKAARSFRSVDLVFWNALFSNDSGYNSLPTREDKIRVFDSALRSLAETVKPDLILVGCNTLSVLLGDVPFARESDIPVLGIIDTGVAMMAEALAEHPEAKGVLLGTLTTISKRANTGGSSSPPGSPTPV